MKWLETESGDLINLDHVARFYTDHGRLIAQGCDVFVDVADNLKPEVLQSLKVEIAEFSDGKDPNPVYFVSLFFELLE